MDLWPKNDPVTLFGQWGSSDNPGPDARMETP
jgi:hypothetical protein